MIPDAVAEILGDGFGPRVKGTLLWRPWRHGRWRPSRDGGYEE
jgi:hypothetical protein